MKNTENTKKGLRNAQKIPNMPRRDPFYIFGCPRDPITIKPGLAMKRKAPLFCNCIITPMNKPRINKTKKRDNSTESSRLVSLLSVFPTGRMMGPSMVSGIIFILS